jgi:hypothetical protein
MFRASIAFFGLFLVTACANEVGDDGSETASTEQALKAKSLNVELGGCVESIGVGLTPIDTARSLVPNDVILVGEGTPVTPVVARTAHCEKIRIDGCGTEAGSIVQLGFVIVPPDGTGDINNYTLYYQTSHKELAQRLGKLGVDAQKVKKLGYALSASTLTVKVPTPGDPKLTLTGTVTPSPTPAGSFLANWWTDGAHGRVKMATNVPVIAVGGADLAFATPVAPELAELGFGSGSPAGDFPALQQFNSFANAELHATVAP